MIFIYKDLNDYELLYMIEENNEDAYNTMISKYRPLVEKWAEIYANSYKSLNMEKDELVQEGLIAVSRAISRYEKNKDVLFYTFVNIVIKREMYRFVKKASTKKQLSLTLAESLDSANGDTDICISDLLYNPKDMVENVYDDIYFCRILYNFTFELNNLESAIYELKLNDFNCDEISKLLSISRKTVSSYYKKIRTKLKLYIQDYI